MEDAIGKENCHFVKISSNHKFIKLNKVQLQSCILLASYLTLDLQIIVFLSSLKLKTKKFKVGQ